MSYSYPIPKDLNWWHEEPGGSEWLARLPALVDECSKRWGLEVGAGFEPASVSFVAPATKEDGTPVVLKINFPEEEDESEFEAHALLHWNGEVSARVIEYAQDLRSIVIEPCTPGERLWMVPEKEAYPIAAGLLRRLHRPAPTEHCFKRLTDKARRWARKIPERYEKLGRPFERSLVDEAASLAEQFASCSGGVSVVLHQDLHGGNILRSTREPWLIIDPKPLVGDREFDIASLLRDRRHALMEDAKPIETMQRRLDLFVDELSLDRQRAKAWSLIHALAWGMSDTMIYPNMIECARWIARLR
jgi:streptomycin 6-kinase